ncbi:DNA repair protein rhp57-like [Spinacia oleracea]|uniref:DNA repair protein rhp57-like n=1 Tax=Spinacia oleracea TaxID=3562 RepID=A0ABM3RBS2_SPIOL|nr:DNA repair protein rhp57-like [Spinacia oleracea]
MLQALNQAPDSSNNSKNTATRCNAIDTVLQGGFKTGKVTEICVENETGKTQFFLQSLLATQLPLHWEDSMHPQSTSTHQIL